MDRKCRAGFQCLRNADENDTDGSDEHKDRSPNVGHEGKECDCVPIWNRLIAGNASDGPFGNSARGIRIQLAHMHNSVMIAAP